MEIVFGDWGEVITGYPPSLPKGPVCPPSKKMWTGKKKCVGGKVCIPKAQKNPHMYNRCSVQHTWDRRENSYLYLFQSVIGMLRPTSGVPLASIGDKGSTPHPSGRDLCAPRRWPRMRSHTAAHPAATEHRQHRPRAFFTLEGVNPRVTTTAFFRD